MTKKAEETTTTDNVTVVQDEGQRLRAVLAAIAPDLDIDEALANVATKPDGTLVYVGGPIVTKAAMYGGTMTHDELEKRMDKIFSRFPFTNRKALPGGYEYQSSIIHG